MEARGVPSGAGSVAPARALPVFASGAATALLAVALLLLSVWTLFHRLGEGSLYDWDEATYGQIAREMARGGDWLTPTWNGHNFFDKPPAIPWLMAIALRMTGQAELAVRLVPALFGVLAIALTLRLGWMMFGGAAALAAASLLLVASPHFSSSFVGLARQGMLDVPLAATTVWAMLHLWAGLRDRRHWVLMGLPLGLAFMIRSFSAVTPFVAAGLGVLLLPLLERSAASRRAAVGGLQVAALVALPWHLVQIARHGRAFLHDYVGLNLFGMATSAADDLAGDWRFYLGVLREGLPGWWWLVPVAAGFAAWRLWRARDTRALLLLGWTVVPFLLYSVAATKLAWYILPIYPGLALMAGWLFATLLPRRPPWQSLALAALLLGTAAWNRRTLEPLHLSWAVKSVGWCAVNAAAPDETIAFFDPARGYQSNQRPFWNIRPSVRFYADRPMAALWDRAAVEGWLLGGGRFIWSDEAAAAQIADLMEVVGREGDQRLLRRADLAGSAVDGVGACRP